MQLELSNVSVDRGHRTIVSDISIQIAAGHALTLKGPNGVGKTTLIRAIAGFLKPSAGTIELSGTANDSTVPENAHYIGHLNALKTGLTVWENLMFWSTFYGSSESEVSCDNAVNRLDLGDLTEIPAGYLSAGQKRRLALARLLSAHRQVWLLDEPTVSLDAHSTSKLASIVDEHLTQGGIVVSATHIPLGISNEVELVLAAA